MIKILSIYLQSSAPKLYLNPKILITLKSSNDLKNAIDQLCQSSDRVTFDTISYKWKHVVQINIYVAKLWNAHVSLDIGRFLIRPTLIYRLGKIE